MDAANSWRPVLKRRPCLADVAGTRYFGVYSGSGCTGRFLPLSSLTGRQGYRREGKAGGQLVSHFGARSHCLPSVWQGEVGRYGEVGGTLGFLLSVCSSLPFPHLPSSLISPEFFFSLAHLTHFFQHPLTSIPALASPLPLSNSLDFTVAISPQDLRVWRLAPSNTSATRDLFFFSSAPDPSPSYPRCGSSSSPWAHFPSSIIHFPLSSLHHPGV